MAVTYTPIATSTPQTSVSSILFSSITSAYTDLVFRVYCQDTTAGLNGGYIGMKINGAVVSNGYYRQLIIATTPEDSSAGNAFASTTSSSAGNGLYFSTSEIYIPSYAQTNYHVIKSITSTEYNNTTNYPSYGGNAIFTSQSINSIEFTPSTAFAVGTRIDLFGILKY